MAELTIQWETLSSIPQVAKKAASVTTGEATEPSPASAEPAASETTLTSTDKPYLIYVQDPAASATTDFDPVEKVILEDDRVRLGAKAFHAVRMSAEDAKADPLLAQKGGKELPRFIFVTADQKTVKALEGGSLKLGEVWSTMKATANKHYKQDLDGLVKELKSVLNDFDKLAKELSVLEEKEKRLTDKGISDADKKDIEAKRADHAVRQKKAEAQRDKLWDLKLKTEPKALAKS